MAVGDDGGDAGNPVRAIVADPRKFFASVLVPGHVTGKGRIFLDHLGFRPESKDAAAFLVEAYVGQAWARIASGAFLTREPTQYGVPYTLVITERGVACRTGWLLRADGLLELVTPFSGFARPDRRDAEPW